MKKIPGYIYDAECDLLAAEAEKVPTGGTIVEIGSYLGKSTYILADRSAHGVTVYAVDTWDNQAMGYDAPRDTYPDFLENIREHATKICAIRGASAEVEYPGKPINLLFIDGDHSEPAVMADLCVWIPKMAPKSVLLMHDYTEPGCGVKSAIKKYMAGATREMLYPRVICSTLRMDVL
jgi:predicted O-methyltransferase YrrM